MIEHTATTRRAGLHLTPRRVRSVLLVVSAAALLGTTTTTEAATSASAPASICSKVTAASVSAIVGYTVPAPTQTVLHLPADKNDYETSSVDTSCTFGAEKSIAEIAKSVTLDIAVAAKPFTEAEILASTKKAEQISHDKFKLVSYSGLGVPAYYLTETADGLHIQVLSGVVGGTHSFGAAVDSATLSITKLAELAKLAEKL
jgi:hypothetical protein